MVDRLLHHKMYLTFVISVLLLFQIGITNGRISAQDSFPTTDVCPEGFRDINNIALSPKSDYVLASWDQGTARLWETTTGKIVHTFQHGSAFVMSVGFSPDERFVVTGGVKEAIVWNTKTGEKIKTFSHDSNSFERNGVKAQFLLDNVHLLTSVTQEVALWNVETGEKLYTLPGHFESYSPTFELSPDGRYLLVPLWTKQGLMKWELHDSLTGKLIHKFDVEYATFSPDSKYVFNGDKLMGLWQISTKTPITNFAQVDTGNYTFSPDGTYLFFIRRLGNQQYIGELWNIEKFARLFDVNVAPNFRAFFLMIVSF